MNFWTAGRQRIESGNLIGLPSGVLVASLFLSVLLFSSSCMTSVDIRAGTGSPDNPVKCESPESEREYLKSLRSASGDPVLFEFLDSILGPDGQILDRFRLENPASKTDTRGFFTRLFDALSVDPDVPAFFRIYMNMYHPGAREMTPPPGFVFLKEEKK